MFLIENLFPPHSERISFLFVRQIIQSSVHRRKYTIKNLWKWTKKIFMQCVKDKLFDAPSPTLLTEGTGSELQFFSVLVQLNNTTARLSCHVREIPCVQRICRYKSGIIKTTCRSGMFGLIKAKKEKARKTGTNGVILT